MKAIDEHGILRSLEDFRIAGAMEPESPESMRKRAAAQEQLLRIQRQLEQEERFRQHDADARKRALDRVLAQRAEAWKRGEPVLETPPPVYDPYRDIARAHGRAMSASYFPCGSAVVGFHPSGYPVTHAEAMSLHDGYPIPTDYR